MACPARPREAPILLTRCDLCIGCLMRSLLLPLSPSRPLSRPLPLPLSLPPSRSLSLK